MLRFLLLAGLLLAGCAGVQAPATQPSASRPAPAAVPSPPPAGLSEENALPAASAATVPPVATTGGAAAVEETASTPPESAAARPAAPRAGEVASASEGKGEALAARQDGGASAPARADRMPILENPGLARLCEEVGNKLGSVSVADCLAQKLQPSGRVSVNGRALALRDFLPADGAPKARVLIMGGIHGDEYSSISILFKWMEFLGHEGQGDFAWRFLPLVNPDGLLDGQAVRQNANGVDLNRNFPSRDWRELARKNWEAKTGSNPRRYPGDAPASEPEVRWVVEQILAWQPDVIVSVHAPYHLLDFDGPSQAPEKIGELYLHQLGVFPGSLGNYAGLDLGLPVVTLELPSAGIMPTKYQIAIMWQDLLKWLHKRPLDTSS